jgi:hypothetical protein
LPWTGKAELEAPRLQRGGGGGGGGGGGHPGQVAADPQAQQQLQAGPRGGGGGEGTRRHPTIGGSQPQRGRELPAPGLRLPLERALRELRREGEAGERGPELPVHTLALAEAHQRRRGPGPRPRTGEPAVADLPQVRLARSLPEEGLGQVLLDRGQAALDRRGHRRGRRRQGRGRRARGRPPRLPAAQGVRPKVRRGPAAGRTPRYYLQRIFVHTHIYTHIYIYICVCVYASARARARA